jgi:hypothetical protein
MKRTTTIKPYDCTRHQRPAATWRALLSGLLALLWLTSISAGPSRTHPVRELHTGGASNAPAELAPFVNVIPDSNGTDLLIRASGVGELGGTVFTNIDTGPSGNKGGWTMTYSDTAQTYFATVTGFSAGKTEESPLSITTTLGLDTGSVFFKRAYIPAKTTQTIASVDGNLQLSLVTTNTITSNTYVTIVPSFAPPGPAPAGHRFVGSVYSARASGALLVAGEPMILRLAYTPTLLDGADPHSLGIFAWDTNAKNWVMLGGQLFVDQSYMSVATPIFATYALMTTTSWRDDFEDFGFSGLDQSQTQNISLDLLGDSLALTLQDTPGAGSAVSQPITPTSVISGWGTLTFSGVAPAPATSLVVDVLSADGTTVLLSNAVSGTSLANIDPAKHPVIRLRTRLSSTAAGQSPQLDVWQITWLPAGAQQRRYIYLPMIVR